MRRSLLTAAHVHVAGVCGCIAPLLLLLDEDVERWTLSISSMMRSRGTSTETFDSSTNPKKFPSEGGPRIDSAIISSGLIGSWLKLTASVRGGLLGIPDGA